jgi:hypothetical protein
MFAATMSSMNTTLRISGGSSIIVRRFDRPKAEDKECNRRNGAAGTVNSENIQSLSLHAFNIREQNLTPESRYNLRLLDVRCASQATFL